MISYNEKYLPDMKHLFKVAFEDSDAFIEFFFSERLRESDVFLHIEDKKVVGAAYSRTFILSIFDKEIKVPFLNGVGVLPTYRLKGIAKKLIKEAVFKYTKNKLPFVLLHPFNVEFYRKLDFESLNFVETVNITRSERENISSKVITSDDLDILLNIYNEYTSFIPAYKFRSIKDFSEIYATHFLDGGHGHIIYYQNKPSGYMLYDKTCVYEYVEIIPGLISSCMPDGINEVTSFVNDGKNSFSMAKICDIYKFMSLSTFVENVAGSFVFLIDGVCYELNVKAGVLEYFFQSSKTPEFSLTSRQILSIVLGGGRRFARDVPKNFTSMFKTFNIYMHEKY
ncbi:MAG: GNAT family N-acetyltransferase [Christensenellaceae bacterium]|jgi:GNAT superfamily N-acetyltransferase|nr:GNAT family N-acetyltransferase [Christensenellaceae bacterium]